MGSRAGCSSVTSAAASSSPKPSSSSSSGSTTGEPPLTSSGANTEAEAESRLQEELDTPEPPSEGCDDPDFEVNLSAEEQQAHVEEGFFEEKDEESGSDSDSDSSSSDSWGADSDARTCLPEDDDEDDDDDGGSQAAVGARPPQAAPTWLDEEVGDIDYPAAPEEEEEENIDGGNDLQAESDIDVWEEADSDDEFDMQAAIERWNAWQRRRAQRRSRDA